MQEAVEAAQADAPPPREAGPAPRWSIPVPFAALSLGWVPFAVGAGSVLVRLGKQFWLWWGSSGSASGMNAAPAALFLLLVLVAAAVLFLLVFLVLWVPGCALAILGIGLGRSRVGAALALIVNLAIPLWIYHADGLVQDLVAHHGLALVGIPLALGGMLWAQRTRAVSPRWEAFLVRGVLATVLFVTRTGPLPDVYFASLLAVAWVAAGLLSIWPRASELWWADLAFALVAVLGFWVDPARLLQGVVDLPQVIGQWMLDPMRAVILVHLAGATAAALLLLHPPRARARTRAWTALLRGVAWTILVLALEAALPASPWPLRLIGGLVYASGAIGLALVASLPLEREPAWMRSAWVWVGVPLVVVAFFGADEVGVLSAASRVHLVGATAAVSLLVRARAWTRAGTALLRGVAWTILVLPLEAALPASSPLRLIGGLVYAAGAIGLALVASLPLEREPAWMRGPWVWIGGAVAGPLVHASAAFPPTMLMAAPFLALAVMVRAAVARARPRWGWFVLLSLLFSALSAMVIIVSNGAGEASLENAGCAVALVGWLTSAALSAKAAPERIRLLRRVAAAVGAATMVVFVWMLVRAGR